MPKRTYNGPSNQSRSSVSLGNEQQYGGSSQWEPQTRTDFAADTLKNAEPYQKVIKDGNEVLDTIYHTVPEFFLTAQDSSLFSNENLSSVPKSIIESRRGPSREC